MRTNECCVGKAFLHNYVKTDGLWWSLCYACGRSYARAVEGLRFAAAGALTDFCAAS